MFKRLPDLAASNSNAPVLAVTIDGKAFTARAGDTVAATLIAAGLADCRTTPVLGVARGPFCMMGVCFDCLVVIDGRPNQQGCMIAVRDGMTIDRQQGAREVSVADVDPVAPERPAAVIDPVAAEGPAAADPIAAEGQAANVDPDAPDIPAANVDRTAPR